MNEEQLNELEQTIRDYRMTLDFKSRMDKNEPFVVLPLKDNPISITFNTTTKTKINQKIVEMETKIKELSQNVK